VYANAYNEVTERGDGRQCGNYDPLPVDFVGYLLTALESRAGRRASKYRVHELLLNRGVTQNIFSAAGVKIASFRKAKFATHLRSVVAHTTSRLPPPNGGLGRPIPSLDPQKATIPAR
jgi:hypothetical protein